MNTPTTNVDIVLAGGPADKTHFSIPQGMFNYGRIFMPQAPKGYEAVWFGTAVPEAPHLVYERDPAGLPTVWVYKGGA